MAKRSARLPHLLSLAAIGTGALALATFIGEPPAHAAHGRYAHVLLLSIDGMHAIDLTRFIADHPDSAMAGLAQHGLYYSNATGSKPSDSFPGLLAILTGGSPASTGVYYDDSYDRTLSAPGSDCSVKGTEIVFDESIDIDPDKLDGGGGIDPKKLPLDPAHGCKPVYPHSFLRTNTIFEVVKAAGLRTAWADKHPAYDLVNGPSGKGVDDLFTPESAANGADGDATAAAAYDDGKVAALLNEIDGKDHGGTKTVGVPALFGMNFQAVSVAQKMKGDGYRDSQGVPSDGLAEALMHTDGSIAKLVAELKARKLDGSTLIVLSAKHGQAPIDPTRRQIVDKNTIPGLIEGVQKGLAAQVTQDSVALIWLSDQSLTGKAIEALAANQGPAAIGKILGPDMLRGMFADPSHDSRVPDIIVEPTLGVIYTKTSATKIAEHGGFSYDETAVPILVSTAGMKSQETAALVTTTQIAPTILRALGLDPQALKSVRLEHTQPLAGLGF
jgi:type I phosphodiesterase/nucleotide pyrophosphatase